jgi:hypothetical protein
MGELNLMCLIKGPDPVTPEVVGSFGDDEEQAVRKAIEWAWNHRRVKGMTKLHAATLVGMPHSHFTNMTNGKKNLAPWKINAYDWTVGNTAVSQTIERFKKIRKEQMAARLATMIVENIGVAA